MNKASFFLSSGSPEETHRLGRQIGELAKPGDVYLLSGNLGSGKTCFTQGVAAGLGVVDNVMSPSFVIMREHSGRLPLYHIDLYRLETLPEAIDLGLNEYLYGKGVSVIEWSERAESVLPAEHLSVYIDYKGDTERYIRLQGAGARYSDIINRLKNIYRADNIKNC